MSKYWYMKRKLKNEYNVRLKRIAIDRGCCDYGYLLFYIERGCRFLKTFRVFHNYDDILKYLEEMKK